MKDESGKVIFDADEQKEIDRIIGERVARVKSEKPQDYDDLLELAKVVEDFDYKGSAKDKAEALKQVREAQKQQAELDKLQKEADEDGITPGLAKKIKDLEDNLEAKTKALDEIVGERQATKQAVEDKKKADEAWENQLKEVQEDEKLKDIDLDKLAEDPKFKKFIKGKALPLKELLEDFIEFVGETEAEAIAKVKSKEERSTSSGKGNSSDGASYGLTNRQKELAKKSGMTYKEYAEYKKQID